MAYCKLKYFGGVETRPLLVGCPSLHSNNGSTLEKTPALMAYSQEVGGLKLINLGNNVGELSVFNKYVLDFKYIAAVRNHSDANRVYDG